MLLRQFSTFSRATGDTRQADVGAAEADRPGAQIKTLIELIEEETGSA